MCSLFRLVDGIRVVSDVDPSLLDMRGPDVDVTALTIAIEKGHLNAVQALIKAGVDVNQKSSSLTSPIHLAVFLGTK